MRMTILGLLLVGSASLVACSGDDGGGIRRGTGTGTETPGGDPGTTPGGAVTTPPSTAITCPAGVPAPISVAQDTNAADIRVVNASAVYRQGPSVFKVDAGGTRSTLYTNEDLVRSFIDAEVLVTIESPNPPETVIKVMPAGPTTDEQKGLELTATPAGWNAAGSYIFASDQTSLYAMADTTGGDTIYKINKANPTIMTQLANIEAASLGDAQLVGQDVWFVREQKRVYKIVQETPQDPNLDPLGLGTVASPATEVFSMENADCKLAVGGSSAYCSTGKALEQRDLKGANLRTVFDPAKAAAPSLLGSAIYGADTVFVRSLPQGPTDLLKNGIRAIKMNGMIADEKFVACGRETITSFAVDTNVIVWTEQGKGVFMAPR
jgi:hypothetical protein